MIISIVNNIIIACNEHHFTRIHDVYYITRYYIHERVDFNILKLFILVHLSIDMVVLPSTNTGRIHLYCDLNQAPHLSEPCVLTTRLTHAARKSVVPGLNHDKGEFFPVFADSKPTISNDRCTSIKGFSMLKYPLMKTSNDNDRVD